MISSKDFFEELRDGDEYLSTLMTKEVYHGIDLEFRDRMVVNTIRQKNTKFEHDEYHKELVREVSKSKAKLRNYEYNENHK